MKTFYSKPLKDRLLVIVALVFMSLTSHAKDFYVSPSGDDTASGSFEAPFATFDYAKSQVKDYKQLHPSESITVYFRGGKYYLTAPVSFTADDSGSESAPITYKAYNDEVPQILGGELLTGLAWTKVDDNIYKTSVPAGLVFETLFINGQQKILARYPNYNANGGVFNGTASDCISSAKVQSWSDPTDGYVHALHEKKWGGNHWKITGKKSSSTLNLIGGFQNNRGSGMHSEFRYVENIFEELDSIDEWYLNRKTSELYYYPPTSLDLENAEIEVAALEQLIVLKGTETTPIKFLSFEGLTLKRTIRTFMKTSDRLLRSDWCIYRGGVVHFEGTENCSIKDCELSDLGGNAIFFNNYNKEGLVTGCHIYNVGASGVCFVGDVATAWHENYDIINAPDLADLNFTKGPKTNNYPQHCKVDDNLIHNIGLVEKQPAGVEISLSAYITVSRNSIYDVPRAGINISEGKWAGHLIEYNDVFKTVLETHDHGAFNSWGRDRYYTKGNSNERVAAHGYDLVLLDILDSTTIRNNRFKCEHGWDIDLDDGSAYYNIYNNVCLNGGLKFRDGFLRTAKNNILINNSFHPHVWFKNSGDVFKNNICIDAYKPVQMSSNWGTEVDSNFFFTESALNNAQNNGIDQNSIFGDPLFVDPDNGDFTVADGSPALAIGFNNFPMDSFGVQKPALKAIAETPVILEITVTPTEVLPGVEYMGGQIKNLETIEELSAVGLGEMEGAWIIKAPNKGLFSVVKLEGNDVVLKLDDDTIVDIDDFMSKVESDKVYTTMTVWRNQTEIIINLPDANDCTVPVELNSAEWSLISTDSEANSNYLAKFAFDNNPATFWHTAYKPDLPYPHEIVVDMGAPYVLDHMDFLARQGTTHPRIKDFQLYVSSNKYNWGEPVLDSTLADTDVLQSFKILKANDGQYFKFVGLSGHTREAAAIAEISFFAGCGVNVPVLSSETELLSFSLSQQTATAVIDSIAHTVAIEVANGTALTGLMPTFTLSGGATSNPESETSIDFSDEVMIVVTAEDMTTKQEWKVNVSVAEASGLTDEVALNALLEIFPNPTTGLLKVKTNDGNTPLEYSIYGLDGHLFLSKQGVSHEGILEINMASFSKGLYILQLMDNNKIRTNHKIVLQ